MKKVLLLLFLSSFFISLFAQHTTIIEPLDDEYWWGAVVAYGSRMPYLEPVEEFDLHSKNKNNQVVPLLLSNKGRFAWSDYPFTFSVSGGKTSGDEMSISISSKFEQVIVSTGGSTLRDAYLKACREHFKSSGQLPDTLFFTMPQYNTWIELMYNQSQEGILDYARGIIKNGLPPGVLMIDDNWQRYYGNFNFRAEKFSNPRKMIDELHEMGFKVMLWVCPYVSADSPEYRDLRDKGYLIKKANGRPAIFNWWNGQSACYDLTHPEAVESFVSTLKNMQEKYGIDGFKFDAGDNGAYSIPDVLSYKKNALSVDHTESWMRIGLEFPFNEYRAGWKMGGQALVHRLGDKRYSWGAVQSLIPEMIAAGLMGYAYTCPDMIGGGQYKSFLDVDPDKFDQTLIVRSAQVHALMPMMQFSVAPWRILNNENMEIVKSMARLHEQMGSYIMACARESSKTGEPIVRHMEYSFPNEGFAECKDQYMLGDKYMIAPIVTPNNKRFVMLPKGKWKDDLGNTYKGGKRIVIDAPLSRLPYFEKLR